MNRKSHATNRQFYANPKTMTQTQPAIATTSNKPKKTLIINHLPQTPLATTGKKPAKPEMNNKPNMIRYDHEIPADRSKNAQPLMVPFYGVEESAKESIRTSKFIPMTKSHIVAANSQKTSTTQPPVAEG